MTRDKIINSEIKKNSYKSYLEIGTQGDNCLKMIECDYKVGVDPSPIYHSSENSDVFHQLTSDSFFKENKDTFDIIFIDGLHHAVQVMKDVNNSLDVLNSGGTIIIHDCSPESYDAQTIPETHLASWNGDVWKAWVKLRMTRPDLLMYVIDTDQGCGVIRIGEQDVLSTDLEVNYDNLDKNRKHWLNLVEYEEI